MHWKILLTSILVESCPLSLGSGFSHAVCIFKQQKRKSWLGNSPPTKKLHLICLNNQELKNEITAPGVDLKATETIWPACFKLTNKKPWFEAVNQLESSNMNQKPTFDPFNHWETHNIVRQESKSACGLCGFLSRLNEWRAMLPELCDEKSP